MSSPDPLTGKFAYTQFLLRRYRRHAAERLDPITDPSRGQGRVLALLKLRDGLSTRDIATVLGVRVSSLNELLSKMDKAGYLSRSPSPQDRRISLVHLTAAGRAVEQRPPPAPALFEDFTDADRDRFEGYLDRLITTLTEDMPDDEDQPTPTLEQFTDYADLRPGRRR